jgi:hypothetical protein
MNEKGFRLIGTICASNITSGVRKDDGKPWARRTAMITTGKTVCNYSEPIEITDMAKPDIEFVLGKDVQVEVTYTNTSSGVISVSGELTYIKDTK